MLQKQREKCDKYDIFRVQYGNGKYLGNKYAIFGEINMKIFGNMCLFRSASGNTQNHPTKHTKPRRKTQNYAGNTELPGKIRKTHRTR